MVADSAVPLTVMAEISTKIIELTETVTISPPAKALP
jgi:hypothetical protein